MDGDRAIALMNAMIWQTMLVAGPILAAALFTGLIVSVLQVATQLQEMTLSYVPKLLVSGFVLLLLGSWMIRQITGFAMQMIAVIPSLS